MNNTKKKFLAFLVLSWMLEGVGNANQTTLMCGGKYIGYDDQFIYLNWQKDKKEFKDKLLIQDRPNKALKVSLATSDTLTLYPSKKYLSYWLYGKERLVYFCKDIKLK